MWYFLKQNTLSSFAKGKMREVFNGKSQGFISIITILEAYYVSLKLKIFDFALFIKALGSSNIKIIPFDRDVLDKCLILPNSLEMHDRIIVATSILANSKLITKDKVLRSTFPLETVW